MLQMQLAVLLFTIAASPPRSGSFLSPPVAWLHNARIAWVLPRHVKIVIPSYSGRVLQYSAAAIGNRNLEFALLYIDSDRRKAKRFEGQCNFWSQPRLESLGLISKKRPGIRNRKRPTIFFERDMGQESCLLYGGQEYYLYASVENPGPRFRPLVDQWLSSIRICPAASLSGGSSRLRLQ